LGNETARFEDEAQSCRLRVADDIAAATGMTIRHIDPQPRFTRANSVDQEMAVRPV
jgi:hypothetical protein